MDAVLVLIAGTNGKYQFSLCYTLTSPPFSSVLHFLPSSHPLIRQPTTTSTTRSTGKCESKHLCECEKCVFFLLSCSSSSMPCLESQRAFHYVIERDPALHLSDVGGAVFICKAPPPPSVGTCFAGAHLNAIPCSEWGREGNYSCNCHYG